MLERFLFGKSFLCPVDSHHTRHTCVTPSIVSPASMSVPQNGGGIWTDSCTDCQCATESFGCYNLTLDVCEDDLQGMFMVPFDVFGAVQRNMSETILDVAMEHVGCFNTTFENCTDVGGIWKGNETSVPGTRVGCFEIVSGLCACNVEMCDQQMCDSNDGMAFWSDCLNCQCSEEDLNTTSGGSGAFGTDEAADGSGTTDGTDTTDGTGGGGGNGNTGGNTPGAAPGQPPIPSGGGFGCYGVGGTFGACDCSAALCNDSACAAAGVSRTKKQLDNEECVV